MMSDKILIAEDSDCVRELLEMALRAEGHDAVAVSSGREALSMLREGMFRLLITDFQMPEMDGIDLMKRARAICPKMPVMVITTCMEALKKRARAEGVEPDAMMGKPFETEELLRVVQQFIDG